MSKDLKPLLKIIGVYIAVVIALAFAIYLIPVFSVSQTGTLGDTLGGILSPLVGLITIYFVLRSYTKQQETHDLEIKNTHYNTIKEGLDELRDRHNSTHHSTLSVMFESFKQKHERYNISKNPLDAKPALLQFNENRTKLDHFIENLRFYKLLHESLLKYDFLPIQYDTVLKKLSHFELTFNITYYREAISSLKRISLNNSDFSDEATKSAYRYYFLTLGDMNDLLGEVARLKLLILNKTLDNGNFPELE